MSIDRDGVPGYPAASPWAAWIDEHVRCDVVGRHGRCQLVRGHTQRHAVALVVPSGRRAWRWTGGGTQDAGGDDGGFDDGGPWGNVAADRAPWIPGWP